MSSPAGSRVKRPADKRTAKSRQACHPAELPARLKRAIAKARMDHRHDVLNAPLRDA